MSLLPHVRERERDRERRAWGEAIPLFKLFARFPLAGQLKLCSLEVSVATSLYLHPGR